MICVFTDEGLPSESEEERKLQAARSAKLRQLIEQLHDKDALIKQSCDEKLKTMIDMRDLFLKEDFGENVSIIMFIVLRGSLVSSEECFSSG